MIEFKHISKNYGKQQVIRDLSFVLHPGEIVGFLGANGAGKSTTMNMITGCLPPTSGSILINGRDITRHPKLVKRQVGYLPEIPPLYDGMTVCEQLHFGGRLKQPGITRSELAKQVSEACRSMDLVPVQNRLISHLSKGYWQRVGLAQAILGDPEVLVLDEPTVGLDPSQIREIHKQILSLSEGHILSEVAGICTRILVLSGGIIAADGTPEELQKTLETSCELILTAAGDQNTLSSVLQRFPQITHVTIHPVSEGVYRCKVTIGNGDIRAALSRALVNEGIELLSFGYRPVSLEDVYERFAQSSTGQRN